MSVYKTRALPIALLASFLLGYMEWGTDQKMFVFQVIQEIYIKAISNPYDVLHPFIIIPFLGFTGLLYTLFQKKPSRLLTFFSVGCMALIILFLFAIGIITANIKMMVFNFPFIVFLVITFKLYRYKI